MLTLLNTIARKTLPSPLHPTPYLLALVLALSFIDPSIYTTCPITPCYRPLGGRHKLVKYSKKWNSFDLIADVDELNNLNNVVVRKFIFVKTSECNCITTISTLTETLPNIRINKVAIYYAP